ncbi:LysM domain-containing protein [Pigmentiphaga litoralis]|uniref:LysM domain-containing protein n=1 Tax=Pigmentiphaga litoralis TaxID=516702 RepID=A0A7Y9IPY8_9BURK|nr:LysM domain-containing protein [Pigmentiphaga litoralis]NYE25473.1 hypothetical protein [Pigmentiphaga litoralis]NYE80915.1 hypothetical protein [Pigmentiphaga litoralis]
MDPVQAFLQANALTPAPHAPGSRYYGVPTAQMTTPDGMTVVYLRRRFLPPSAAFSVLKTVAVASDDRLDTVAAQHLGDPLQWWRIADGNGAMLPEAVIADALEQPGAGVAITLPEGVAGVSDGE